MRFKFGALEYEVEQTNYFCPHCGKQSIVEEMGEGDYYDGPLYACAECMGSFCHPASRYEPAVK